MKAGARSAWLILAAAAATSCGPDPGGVEPATRNVDASRAKEALITALDGWKKGQPRELSRRSPPIRFSDDDCASGLRLVDYELMEPDAPIVPMQDVGVILSLRDAQGRSVHRETSYQVLTDPSLAVLRSDP